MELLQENEIIVKMKFGSHLYGTNTPESDLDIKGVFMPSKREIALGIINKSINNARDKKIGEKNSSKDVDIELYSLHYFIKLACEGQTVALDMLHAPVSMLIETSELWNGIVANRELFYTKNLKAFVGYARKQAAKYGIKGSRLSVIANCLSLLDKYSPEAKMSVIWDKLPITEHSHMCGENKQGINEYQICGKKFQSTASVGYVHNVLLLYSKAYGDRAKLAANNKGIDWKAISHALRAAYQVKQLLTENTIIFPLKEASFLRDVKQGKLNYVKEVAPILEDLMVEVDSLSKNSGLPTKVDKEYWDNFIIKVVENIFENEELK